MSVSTSTSGIDANGDLFVYARGSVSAVNRGYSVSNGAYNQLNAGEQVTLAGVVQCSATSGLLQATGPVGYRLVTVTAGPPSGPAASTLPLSTRTVGVTAAGVPVVYAPPYANPVPTGSSVTYGMWTNLEEGETLPAAPALYEIISGAEPVQAMNQAFWRQVTITPL